MGAGRWTAGEGLSERLPQTVFPPVSVPSTPQCRAWLCRCLSAPVSAETHPLWPLRSSSCPAVSCSHVGGAGPSPLSLSPLLFPPPTPRKMAFNLQNTVWNQSLSPRADWDLWRVSKPPCQCLGPELLLEGAVCRAFCSGPSTQVTGGS